MPGFDFLNKVELYVRTGSYPPHSPKVTKQVIRAASKHFSYRDSCLWRSYRGRLLRVVRSNEEVREILTCYHDNNEHAGQKKMMKLILSLYYWGRVTEAVKNWIKDCPVCRGRTAETQVQFCLAYGCDSTSYVNQDLSFHRFPKDPERRKRWLAAAQRDEGSLQSDSCLCSRHFKPACFKMNQEGRATLTPDAVPTAIPATIQEEVHKHTHTHTHTSWLVMLVTVFSSLCKPLVDPGLSQVTLPGFQVLVVADEDFLHTANLEDLIAASSATETTEQSEPALAPSGSSVEPPGPAVEVVEHEYCLPSPATDSRTFQKVREDGRRKCSAEPSFVVYDQIARYLSHRILPVQGKKNRNALKRMAKRFGLIDGVLMYTRVSPPVKVPRSRDEVNSILQQFHDNQGHYGQGICQRAIMKHFYWGTMSRDLAHWISTCHTCLNRTKRRWLRCSAYNCTNCCGPVERGLGMTFHKFPLHNPGLMARWLRSLGRPSWHPRLWSSVCSAHFTDNCFDRSGEKVTLRPDAVPSLFVYSDPVTQSRTPTQSTVVEEVTTQDQIFFAKYDAVEHYIRRGTYPPGLNYVEKNTFRRFCKKFTIKDDQLHVVKGDRVRLVLRGRQQVEAALVDYHDELNHLDLKKCLRLLNDRFFWNTMRPDVVRWIDSCSQCSRTSKKKPEDQTEPEDPEMLGETLGPPQIQVDLDSGDDDDDGGGGGDDDDADGDEEWQPATHPRDTTARTPISPQARATITRVWSVRRVPAQSVNPSQPRVQRETCGSQIQPQNQSSVQFELVPQIQAQSQIQEEMSGSQIESQNPSSARPQHHIQFQVVTQPLSQPHPQTELPTKPQPQAQQKSQVLNKTSGSKIPPLNQNSGPQLHPDPQTQTQTKPNTCRCTQRPVKRKKKPEPDSPAKRSSSCGMEPVVAQSTKPWPVFTIVGSAPAQRLKPTPEEDRPPACLRPSKLQARTVVQQCSQARVKVKPAIDGADAVWAEIQEGMVVYVCFFCGATKEVVQNMADTLLNAKLFRNASRQPASVLEVPGSVLFIPQDSLLGELVPRRRMQYKGNCQRWWGAQLYASLVSACREAMAGSAKCVAAGVTVEQGVYGQKQEILLNSLEPLTHLLEF